MLSLAPRSVESLRLIAGISCLDFVNTVDPRHAEVREDYLDSYPSLVAWAVRVGLEHPSSAARLVRLGKRYPVQAARVLARAVSLRESLYALCAPGCASSPDALAVLNEELHRAWSCTSIVQTADAYELGSTGEQALDRVLWPVTLSALELLTQPHAPIKECEDDECGWLFVDTSKAGRRRWCSMASCGNRAKMRRYRSRYTAS